MTSPTTTLPAHLLTLHSADGAQISVSRFGGHLCSWRGPAGDERLFMSRQSRWDDRTALRGGVPVIFPQFADFGTLPRHGFARLQNWELRESRALENGSALMRLALNDSDATQALAGQFRIELTITFSDQALYLTLQVHNTGTIGFSFTAALHTYLRCAIDRSAIEGLHGHRYLDSTRQREAADDLAAKLMISGEIDRIYPALFTPVHLQQGTHRIEVTQRGFEDLVIWNPGAEKAAALVDLDADEYRQFVCIEAALIDRPCTLLPKQIWQGEQYLRRIAATGDTAAPLISALQ